MGHENCQQRRWQLKVIVHASTYLVVCGEGLSVRACARLFAQESIHAKKVERRSNSRFSAAMSSDNIANFRRVIGTTGNLSESERTGSSGSSPGTLCLNTQHELADRLRIPRSAGISSGTIFSEVDQVIVLF